MKPHTLHKVSQRGVALVELILAISVSATLAVAGFRMIVQQAEEHIAAGSATYMTAVANATQHHVLLNFNDYANLNTVAGVAIALQPTVPELIALGRLNPGFPSGPGVLPTRQSILNNIIRTNCPGPTCVVQILTCTTTPVTLGGTFVRFDLASTMVSEQNGGGGQSLQGQGGTIRGPVINSPNPMGNVEGIVCASASVDVALYQRFVTIGDTRDPALQGNLTVAGATTLNSTLTVAGATNLNGPTIANGSLTANGPTTINNNLNTTGNLTVGGTTTLNGPSTINNSLQVNGVVTTNNTINGGQFNPVNSYAAGTPCTAAEEGSIAKLSGGVGLAICQGGSWRALTITSTVGAVCSPEGSQASTVGGKMLLCVNGAYRAMDAIITFGTPGTVCINAGTTAIDTANNNETLICRANPAGGPARYFRLRDLTSNLVFVSASEETDEAIVTKPICNTAAGMTSSPILNLFPKVISSPDGGFSMYGVDNGASWIIKLKSGAGTPLLGSPGPRVVAQAFCYYF